jgi:hypothetical protein
VDLSLARRFRSENGSNFTCSLVLEEIARFPISARMLSGHWLEVTPLNLTCKESQIEKYLPLIESELAVRSKAVPCGIIVEAVR